MIIQSTNEFDRSVNPDAISTSNRRKSHSTGAGALHLQIHLIRSDLVKSGMDFSLEDVPVDKTKETQCV